MPAPIPVSTVTMASLASGRLAALNDVAAGAASAAGWGGTTAWAVEGVVGEDMMGGGNPTSGPLETILLIDFVPMQFDGTILCVGDETGVWPSDYELLQTLLAKPVPKASPLRRRYLGIAAACFGVGAVIVTVSVLSTVQMSRAALPPNADDNARRVTEALAAARIDGLNAHAVGDTVVVTGMLASSADDSAVRQLLRRLTITQVAPQYDVAPQVARSIEDSLGVPGARVQYGGGGRFVIKGSVGNKMALDAAIARVRADLDPNVKDIVADVSESASNATSTDATAYSEMISADGVQYAQTPDGVKHIYASDPQDASAADNAANAAANGAADSGVTGANGTVAGNANTGVSAPAKVAATGTAAGAQAAPAAGKPARAGASRKDAAANAPGAAGQRNTADEFVPLPSASAELPCAARTHAPTLASATRPAALAQRAEPPSRQPAPPIAG